MPPQDSSPKLELRNCCERSDSQAMTMFFFTVQKKHRPNHHEGQLASNRLSRSVIASANLLALQHGSSAATFRLDSALPASCGRGRRAFGFAVGRMNACGAGYLGTAPRACAAAAMPDSSNAMAARYQQRVERSEPARCMDVLAIRCFSV